MAYDYAFQEPLLSVKGLGVSYENPILRDVNFSIRNIVRPGYTQGQVDAILAPSGTGKTQLFRCISGLQKPSVGEVLVGQDQVPVHAGQVGVVAQDYPLFGHLTVWDNVFMAAKLKLKNPQEAHDKALALFEQFGLSDKRHNYPHQLSGGQRQRASIIQQIICSGHVLLMDEPFSGLDINMKDNVEKLIQSIAAQDELMSVLITTHDVEAAISIADTIILLGHERDATGAVIPGATVRYTYNLIDMGLTWRPDIQELPQFRELQREIYARFKEL